MPAFFLITGILSDDRKIVQKSFLEFGKKKAKRLLLPYVVFEVVGGLWQMLLLGTQSVNLTGIVYGIFTIHCHVGADWFLPTLFFAELLFYWILKIKSKKIRLLIALCALIVAFGAQDVNYFVANCRRISVSLAFIILGMCSRELLSKKSLPLLLCSMIGVVLIAYFNKTVGIAMRQFNNPILFVAGGLFGTYALLYISEYTSNHKRISVLLEQIGRASLPIMGTHQNVLIPFNLLFGDWTSYAVKLSILAITAVVEYGTICFTKRFLPSWVGEKRSV